MSGPHDNVEIVRGGYEATERDRYAVLDLLAPDAEWHSDAGSAFESRYIGPEGARRWIDEVSEVWGDYRIEPREFVPVGEYVIVPVRVWVQARLTGVEGAVDVVHAWQLRGGKVLWTRGFETMEQALAEVQARRGARPA